MSRRATGEIVPLGAMGVAEIVARVQGLFPVVNEPRGGWTREQVDELERYLLTLRLTREEALAEVDRLYRGWLAQPDRPRSHAAGTAAVTKLVREGLASLARRLDAEGRAWARARGESAAPEWVRDGYPTRLAWWFADPDRVRSRYPVHSVPALSASTLRRFTRSFADRMAEDPRWTPPGWLLEYEATLEDAAGVSHADALRMAGVGEAGADDGVAA